MSARAWIDYRIGTALHQAFDQIDKYQRDGYCTPEDVRSWIASGWGEDILERWNEWLSEGEDY